MCDPPIPTIPLDEVLTNSVAGDTALRSDAQRMRAIMRP